MVDEVAFLLAEIGKGGVKAWGVGAEVSVVERLDWFGNVASVFPETLS